MARARCPDCNRWAATERQFHRWFRFSQRHGWRKRVSAPLWWRLDTTCLQWYDCPGEYDPGYRPVRWWIRRAFDVPS